MAKSETKTTGTQTELATTPASEVEQRAAGLKAEEERLAKLKREQEEAAEFLKRKEAELEQRARELRAGAQHLDARQAELDAKAATLAPQAERLETPPGEHVLVLNNSRRTIGAADGTPLVPTLVTSVSRAVWARWFGQDGKPVPGAAEHFDTAGGKRPDLQEVSLKNLSALPDEHALSVVESATDVALLSKFLDVEPRESVKLAVHKRLTELRKR